MNKDCAKGTSGILWSGGVGSAAYLRRVCAALLSPQRSKKKECPDAHLERDRGPA